MESYIDLDVDDDVIGIRALRKIKAEGPARHLMGIILDKETPVTANVGWLDIVKNGRKIGDMTNNTWSRRLKRNIGFALVPREFNVGDRVELHKDGETLAGELCKLPFC